MNCIYHSPHSLFILYTYHTDTATVTDICINCLPFYCYSDYHAAVRPSFSQNGLTKVYFILC